MTVNIFRRIQEEPVFITSYMVNLVQSSQDISEMLWVNNNVPLHTFLLFILYLDFWTNKEAQLDFKPRTLGTTTIFNNALNIKGLSYLF